MLCEKCNKNEATIHYTEVINGVRKERNLCSECMQELDYNMDGEFPFSKLLKGILTAHLGNVSFENNPAMQIKCNKCGMDYEEFTHLGKFGCAECYSVFGPLILDNIKKIQGNSIHTGKKYRHASDDAAFDEMLVQDKVTDKSENEDLITKLQGKLKEAIRVEEYEEAARLRDEIKMLKESAGKDA